MVREERQEVLFGQLLVIIVKLLDAVLDVFLALLGRLDEFLELIEDMILKVLYLSKTVAEEQ